MANSFAPWLTFNQLSGKFENIGTSRPPPHSPFANPRHEGMLLEHSLAFGSNKKFYSTKPLRIVEQAGVEIYSSRFIIYKFVNAFSTQLIYKRPAWGINAAISYYFSSSFLKFLQLITSSRTTAVQNLTTVSKM